MHVVHALMGVERFNIPEVLTILFDGYNNRYLFKIININLLK